MRIPVPGPSLSRCLLRAHWQATRPTLAGFDPDTLRPLSKREVYARAARRAKIEADMARVAKASERSLP
jgi:hypothetical protein